MFGDGQCLHVVCVQTWLHSGFSFLNLNGHRVALLDVDVLRNCLCARGENQDLSVLDQLSDIEDCFSLSPKNKTTIY